VAESKREAILRLEDEIKKISAEQKDLSSKADSSGMKASWIGGGAIVIVGVLTLGGVIYQANSADATSSCLDQRAKVAELIKDNDGKWVPLAEDDEDEQKCNLNDYVVEVYGP
jgi:hypothetical protein